VAEVIGTDAFEEWFLALDEAETDAVKVAVDLLETLGVVLGFPWSSALRGTKLALRELRVQSKGRPIRIAYAFDPERQAVLLLGARKSGKKERFYREFIRDAESLWKEYLAAREAEASRKKNGGKNDEDKELEGDPSTEDHDAEREAASAGASRKHS